MDQTTFLILLVAAAAVGVIAVGAILNRDGVGARTTQESPYGTSTEGMKRCPSCGVGNLVTDGTCSGCGKPLPR